MCKTPYKPLAAVACKDLPESAHTCAACKFDVGGLSHYALGSMDQMVSTVKSVHGKVPGRNRAKTLRKVCGKEGENMLRVVVSRMMHRSFAALLEFARCHHSPTT